MLQYELAERLLLRRELVCDPFDSAMLYQSNYARTLAIICAGAFLLAALSGCSEAQHADAALVAEHELSAEQTRQAISEAPVGEFEISVPIRIAGSNVWYRVTFDLAIGVAETDEADAVRIVEEQKNRLGDQISATVRRTELDDLKNAQLGELRVRLVDAINREVGYALAQDVFMANFNVEEG